MINFTGSNEVLLNASWSQVNSARQPVESFVVIIKPCPGRPCHIDPDMPQPDETSLPVNRNNSELIYQTILSMPVASVVVCAVNALGKNCSSSFEINVPFTATSLPTTITTPTSLATTLSQNSSQLPLIATSDIIIIELPEASDDWKILIWVVLVVITSILLCCLIFIMLLLICCFCRRNKEISYYPRE